MTIPVLKLYLFWCLGAFLAGSIPFGLVLVKLAGKGDVRAHGSGNIGATNVMRAGGKALGIATLLLDALKGFLPVFLARTFGFAPEFLAFVALAAVLGHVFTPWLRFQGGKGVATAIGVLFGLVPVMALATLGVWLAVAYLTRYSSLAAIVAALFVPLGQLLVYGASPAVLAISVMSLLLVWRHEANIRKLFAGTESKIGQKAGAPAVDPANVVHKPSHHTRHQRKGKH